VTAVNADEDPTRHDATVNAAAKNFMMAAGSELEVVLVDWMVNAFTMHCGE